MRKARAVGWALLVAFGSGAPTAAATPDAAPAKSAERKLPELPTPPSVELGRPDAADLAEVDALLGRIIGDAGDDRDNAVRELLEAERKHVSAIRFRLGSIADNADKEAMKRLLLKTRREALQQKSDDESDKPSAGLDYLGRLVAKPEPQSEAWRNLVSVLALSRMLESIGDVAAVRGLIEVYVRYGEFLRITTQNALARLGDKAVPALVEAQRHPAEKINKWAVRQLDMLGKGIPSEAVQTQDLAVLADVLRAYGRTRNPDAVRIVVSFVSSERAQVREAARQAVALMGEVATWQLRDTYENVVGKKPPRDWAWERTARELFAEFDRLRFAQVGKLFDEGQAARARGDLAEMRTKFDELLAHDPNFEQRAELAAGYVAFAESVQDSARPDAIMALRRAERLDPKLQAASSLRLTLEAEALEERGIADATLLERALERDAANSRAKSALARFERGEPKRSEKARYVAAGSILAVALGAIAFLFLRRRSSEQAPVDAVRAETMSLPSADDGSDEPSAQQPTSDPADQQSAVSPPAESSGDGEAPTGGEQKKPPQL